MYFQWDFRFDKAEVPAIALDRSERFQLELVSSILHKYFRALSGPLPCTNVMMWLHEDAMGRLDSSLVNGLVQGDLTRSGYDLRTLHPQEAREVMAQLKVAPTPREFALKDRPYRPSIKKKKT